MTTTFCPHCMADLKEKTSVCPVCGHDMAVRAVEGQLPIGTVLTSPKNHRFIFGKIKGGGGFGRTYIAKELGSGKTVAIKEYFPLRCHPVRGSDLMITPASGMEAMYERGRKSFLSEASMLRAINNHKTIVHIMDYFDANNTAYMVMEYLDGTTLSDCMRTQKRFEPTMLFAKFIPLMKDIGSIHNAGVIHRDIAPDNIMLMPDGTMKLLDFGCARAMEDGKSMTVLLKPGFAPIEQYQTRGQGAHTDVYSLAATIYYCITGKTPVDAPARLAATVNGDADPLVPPSQAGARVSKDIDDLLMWCMSLQPGSRLQSMEKAADLLNGILEKESPVSVTTDETDKSVITVTDNNIKEGTTGSDRGGGNHDDKNDKKITTAIAVVIAATAVIILILLLLFLK